MPTSDKNNYIAIAKAIGIILMVIGHSGCPFVLRYFLYTFHMPLFFICSGYFYKEITNRKTLSNYVKKKIMGLYLPYIKWSICFILLHNLFYKLNIYNTISQSHYYSLVDYYRQIKKMVIMSDYELLIRPFWFVKELLLASLSIAIISFLQKKFFPKSSYLALLILFLSFTGLSKLCPSNTYFTELSILFFSISYLYSGIIIKHYKHHFSFSYTILLGSFFIVISSSILINRVIDMRYTTATNYIPYYFLSICGIIMTFLISKLLERSSLRKCFYYIGNHTMPILALNLLALKLGSLIKIWIYNLPIEKLSSHPIIRENNDYFWLLYTFIGVVVPLIMHYLYRRFCTKIEYYLEIRK